jgi:hypothetical protein
MCYYLNRELVFDKRFYGGNAMKCNYSIPAILVMSMVSTASFGRVPEITPEKAQQIKKEYEAGLTKVTVEDLGRLEDALKYAAKRETEMFQDCIKGRAVTLDTVEKGREGHGSCAVYGDKAAMRMENANAVYLARTTTPLGLAEMVLREIANGQDPRVLPSIQDPHEAKYDYRKDNPKHLAPGDLSRGEEVEKFQGDLDKFQKNFVYEKSKALVPDPIEPKWHELSTAERMQARNEYDRAKQKAAYDRVIAADRIKKIARIPTPKGFFEKKFDKVRSWFGAKPDTHYADYMEQLIGTPSKPWTDHPLDK